MNRLCGSVAAVVLVLGLATLALTRGGAALVVGGAVKLAITPGQARASSVAFEPGPTWVGVSGRFQ